jgi:hypothetical protein
MLIPAGRVMMVSRGLGANRPVVSIPKELVRNEKATNGACGIEDETFATSHQRWQTADSVPHSSPSRTTQDNMDDHVWEERDCDTADLGTESPLKEEDALLLAGTIVDLKCSKKHIEFLRDNFCKA